MYITQCIIAKNEEENIGHCLSHLKSVVDEQIVVDTGSTDRTAEIARELGAKVFHFDWINDFSAARNFALDKAKGDWIIFLDCDEYFSEESVELIQESISVASLVKGVKGITCKLVNIDKENNILSLVQNVSPRIFKRKKKIRYKNKVHETLFDEDGKKYNYTVLSIDRSEKLKIFHTGYDVNVIKEKNKNERNINLLKEELAKEPSNPKLNLYLSKQFYMNKEYDSALEFGLKALDNMDDKENEYYPTIYSIIMNIMLALLKPYDEIKSIFDKAIRRYPEYPDYYRALGIAALNSKDSKSAIEYLKKCIFYCEKYSSGIESLAYGQVDKVYRELLTAYILDNNKHKIVETSVSILKTDRYDLEILISLLKTFLTQEKEEDIIAFFEKLYDYSNFKDKIFLMKSSEIVNNEKLIDFYKGLLIENEFNELENYLRK